MKSHPKRGSAKETRSIARKKKNRLNNNLCKNDSLSIDCPRCGIKPAEVHPQYGVIWCRDCRAKVETYSKGKPRNLTEGSERIKKQREKHHDDLIQPHTYNKTSKKLEINPEFVDKYPDKVHNFFSPEEIKRAGYSRLVDYSKQVQSNESRQKEKIAAFKERVIEARTDPERYKSFIKNLVR